MAKGMDSKKAAKKNRPKQLTKNALIKNPKSPIPGCLGIK